MSGQYSNFIVICKAKSRTVLFLWNVSTPCHSTVWTHVKNLPDLCLLYNIIWMCILAGHLAYMKEMRSVAKFGIRLYIGRRLLYF
jgi:hypothetical protein